MAVAIPLRIFQGEAFMKKRIFRLSLSAILIFAVFASMSVFASCGHYAWPNYSNSEKWAKGTTTSPGRHVTAYVTGTYRLPNDYTVYKFYGNPNGGTGTAVSQYDYPYNGTITFTLVDNNWTCGCGASGVA